MKYYKILFTGTVSGVWAEEAAEQGGGSFQFARGMVQQHDGGKAFSSFGKHVEKMRGSHWRKRWSHPILEKTCVITENYNMKLKHHWRMNVIFRLRANQSGERQGCWLLSDTNSLTLFRSFSAIDLRLYPIRPRLDRIVTETHLIWTMIGKKTPVYDQF